MYCNQVKLMSIQLFSLLAIVNVGKFFFFLAKNRFLNSFVFWRSPVNYIFEIARKTCEVKLSSMQSICVWQLLMMAIFFKFFVAGNSYFSQVVFGGVNFILEKRKKRLYHNQVKLRLIQSFC